MYILLILLLTIQQWSTPIRVSTDTLPDTNPAICVDDLGIVWVSWYNSNHLWTKYYSDGEWSEVFQIDTTKCQIPEVTTSSVCKGTYEIPAWIIAWTDSKGYIRLSLCDMMPIAPSWITTARDLRITGHNPTITYDTTGNIWCAWTAVDTSGAEYCYLVSYYDGNEWAEPMLLQRFAPFDITYTMGITVDYDGNIWVSYNDHQAIWIQYWDGDSWSVPESIGACFDYAYPTMCADSSNVWVVWYRIGYGGGTIFARYYNGTEWSDLIEFPHVVDSPSWQNSHADICWDDRGNLWAGWWETIGIWCPNYAIIGGSYENGVWADTSFVDSTCSAWGGYPSIACGDGKVWMVWQSEKEGYYNIYASYNELVVGIEDKPISTPNDFVLLQNYPNPFNSLTAISYRIADIRQETKDQRPENQHVVLRIFDLSGSLVKTFDLTNNKSPFNQVVWDGKDEQGRNVNSGIYFYQLKTSSGIEHNRKMIILR
jgi:hypothetical protein